MRLRQVLLCTTLLLIAYLIQVTVLARLPIPGATPDLVIVTVVALALAYGPVTGAVCGFAAGVVLETAPPADGPIGVAALLYLIAGALTGAVIDPRDRTVPILTGIVGLTAGAVVLASAAFGTVLGSDRVVWATVPGLALTSTLYAVILAPFVLPGVDLLVRRSTVELAVNARQRR
jgi:rod shape-determining protein MreD